MLNEVSNSPNILDKVNDCIKKPNLKIKGCHAKQYNNVTEKINSILIAIFLSTVIIGWIIPINNISVICCAIIALIYFFNNGIKNILSKEKIILIFFVIVWFMISLINDNIEMKIWGNYFLYFIIYGVIALVITEKKFSKITVYKYIMLISIFAIPNIISKQFYTNYSYKDAEQSKEIMIMSYAILPIIISCINVIFTKKERIVYRILAIIPFAIYTFLIISKSSRGPILALAVYFLLRILFYKPKKNKKILKIIIIAILIICIILSIIFIENILIAIKNILDSMSMDSMFVDRMLQVLNEDDGSMLSGRESIYDQALNDISSTFIIGNGISAYESQYGHYVHNILLQIIYEGGIICIGYFGYLMYNMIKLLIKKDKEKVEFLCFLIAISLVQLMISSYYWSSLKFWILIGYIIYLKNSEKKEKIKI